MASKKLINNLGARSTKVTSSGIDNALKGGTSDIKTTLLQSPSESETVQIPTMSEQTDLFFTLYDKLCTPSFIDYDKMDPTVVFPEDILAVFKEFQARWKEETGTTLNYEHISDLMRSTNKYFSKRLDEIPLGESEKRLTSINVIFSFLFGLRRVLPRSKESHFVSYPDLSLNALERQGNNHLKIKTSKKRDYLNGKML